MNLRLRAIGGGAACLILVAACGGSATSSGNDLGGLAGASSETGGDSGIGGSGGGDDSTGGKASTGGKGGAGSTGGVAATGGAETGGGDTGGAATGGVGLGGVGGEGETGGSSSGGGDTGGTGGNGTGGNGTGGNGTGGNGTGGNGTGGNGTGGNGTGGVANAIGCSDGQREGFVDLAKYPNIASCSGAWKVAGISAGVTASLTPSCNRGSGDDSANLDGTGCNVSDLCETGWHVCATTADVTANIGESGSCSDSVDAKAQEKQFFATRQAGPGYTMCGTGENDLFGCGTLGDPASDNCGPLDLYGGDGCWALGAPWSCQGGLTEAASVTKSTSARGGVMCCRD
jgi:hypothetical protein